MSLKVLVTAPYFVADLDRFRDRFTSAGIELRVVPVRERLDEDELLPLVGGVDGVICGDDRFSERVLKAAAPRLKVISKWGTGIDSIDIDAAVRFGVRVCNTPNAFTDAVADTTLGYVLVFARRLQEQTEITREGSWKKLPALSLAEMTIGIIGVGNIGGAVAKRAKAFGMRILGNDIRPVPPRLVEETGLRPTSIEELLAQADIVTLHCDLNPTSRHLVNRTRLALMKRGAFLINTARGPVVDETALVSALREGALSGAALDVFECEPLPLDSPLRQMSNVWLAPHNANSSPRAREKVQANTISNLFHGLGLDDAPLCKHSDVSDVPIIEPRFPALIIEGPGRARLTDVLMPEIGADDVVIKVAYVGVCRTDLEIFDGSLGYYTDGLGSYPIVPGHEMSGVVAGFGPAVQELHTGDRVVVECIQSCGACLQCARDNWIGCADRKELGVLRANGAYARYVVVPARFVHRLPAAFDLARAALCEPLAVCLKGLDRLDRLWSGSERTRHCAVVGVGPIGRLCALVLAHRGHSVTAFDCDPRRLADLPALGIAISDRLIGLEKFDAIVEATGDPGALEQILNQSAPGSALLLLGLPYAARSFNFETIVAYDKIVVGSVGSSKSDFRRAIELLPALPLDAYVRTVFSLGNFAEAWALFRAHGCMKVLLTID